MALFHKLLKNKNNPELYDPQKHKKLIMACFEKPEVVFKAIDK